VVKRKRRILFTSLPFVSHFLGQLPLAKDLAGAGHDVRFATSNDNLRLANQAGFDVVPLPILPSAPAPDALRIGDTARTQPVFSYLPHAARIAPALIRAFGDWCPDAIVRDPLEFGSCLAAEHSGIPHVVGREGPFWPPSVRQEVLGVDLGDW
jgi:UDP:flavonoid glycosyltransferase YjiC (YdhE family)